MHIKYYNLLAKHLHVPFTIAEDGTSQTKLANTGRMGFWGERLMGIKPNNVQEPDTPYFELKFLQSTCKTCSVGTITKDTWDSIQAGQMDSWQDSPLYNKMRNCLFVFHELNRVRDADGRLADIEYTINSYGLIDLDTYHQELQAEWDIVVRRIKRLGGYSNFPADHRGKYTNMDTDLLKLTGKGDAYYVYPSLSLKPELLRRIMKLTIANTRQHQESLKILQRQQDSDQAVLAAIDSLPAEPPQTVTESNSRLSLLVRILKFMRKSVGA